MTVKVKRHITAMLLGLFFFPILYQSYHVVWYHSGFSFDDHVCHETACEREQVAGGILFLPEEVDTCPILTYKFPVRDLPQNFLYSADLPQITAYFDHTLKSEPCKQKNRTESSRAPPAAIFS